MEFAAAIALIQIRLVAAGASEEVPQLLGDLPSNKLCVGSEPQAIAEATEASGDLLWGLRHGDWLVARAVVKQALLWLKDRIGSDGRKPEDRYSRQVRFGDKTIDTFSETEVRIARFMADKTSASKAEVEKYAWEGEHTTVESLRTMLNKMNNKLSVKRISTAFYYRRGLVMKETQT